MDLILLIVCFVYKLGLLYKIVGLLSLFDKFLFLRKVWNEFVILFDKDLRLYFFLRKKIYWFL